MAYRWEQDGHRVCREELFAEATRRPVSIHCFIIYSDCLCDHYSAQNVVGGYRKRRCDVPRNAPLDQHGAVSTSAGR